MLLAASTPAVGSFHETTGSVADRTFVLVMQGTSFNGLHAPDAPLLEAYLGERVRFVTLAAEAHTFHLHGHPWIVDGKMVDTFLTLPETPHAFDVTAGGPDGHAGDWMYHCHFDSHMAQGMWGVFRVYPFMVRLEKVRHGIEVTTERLGIPIDGVTLTVELDGAPLASHVVDIPEGDLLHADLPASGELVVTATHPTWGTSVGRLSLDGSTLAHRKVTHAH